MGIAGWFGPHGWNEGWEENFEFKKMMNDDLGVSTGEQGTVARYVKTSKLARKMLMPLTKTLERLGYVGDLDVNCIIDEKGQAWPLEFTARLGWPAFHLQNALQQGDPVEWLMKLANGEDSRSMLMNKIAVGVVLSIPDYPYSHATQREVVGIPIYGLTESLWRHWHPCQIKIQDSLPNVVAGEYVKMPMPATAGDYVGVMTAVADTVKDAALTCYKRLKKLTIPNNAQWRSDIGRRLIKQLPLIQRHGYATGMEY
jgi:phosphoribosylamine--glycine ligase